MKTLHRVLIGFVIVIATSSNAMAADYLVSGAGANEVNGLYAYFGLYRTEKIGGIYSNQDMPVFKNINNDYYLAYRGCSRKWVIIKLVNGPTPQNIGGGPGDGYLYVNVNDLENPPPNGWEAKHSTPEPAPTVSLYTLSPISISPSSLSPFCTEGNNASSQSFEVWTSGGGTLSYSISDNDDWLSCTPTSGTSTGEHDTITVNYSTSSLSAGTHSASITITDSGTSNSTITIPVKLTVGDSDADGVSDQEEKGPNGTNDLYDGNGDNTPDWQQADAVSMHTFDKHYYVTLAIGPSTPGTLSNCSAVGNPIGAPKNVHFRYGFFKFTIEGVGAGGNAIAIFYLPVEADTTTYYKQGPTLSNPAHWYEFMYDDITRTGAVINGNKVTLHFVDGKRGDDDLDDSNGTIVDDGGPGVTVSPSSGVDTSGGGGGCFIATAAYGSSMEPYVKILSKFRDRYLLERSIGKTFVNFYYKYSPTVANFITKHDNLRAIVRVSLLPVVGMSWIILKFGLLPTIALVLFFSMGMIGLRGLRRKRIKD